MLLGYAGKELVKLSTVLPQGLATLPLRANQDVDPANEMYWGTFKLPILCCFCIHIVIILSLKMSLNLPIFGVLKKFFWVGGLYARWD